VTSQPFQSALAATGYLTPNGKPAPGLTQAGETGAARLRPVLTDERIGLRADAVFSAQNTPTAIFKDAGAAPPAEDEIRRWHEAAWNVGVAPLLWIVTPTDVRLYNCYESPRRSHSVIAPPVASTLGGFDLASDDQMRALDAMCGRLATETGSFWSSAIGLRIDRRHRVDRELLSEINALEARLTEISSDGHSEGPRSRAEVSAARQFAQRLIGRCIFTWYLLDRGIAQRFLPRTLPPKLVEMFATPRRALDLFDWLRHTFNGDLFPMDDPGAEQERLGEHHLSLIQDFIEGRSLVPERQAQGRLFQFRFEAIPVDLISAIYQQFARSSAVDEAHLHGLHYTPIELVHLALDPVFEGLPTNARIIDPTCGSGAFLVEAFRQLIWKATQGERASRQLVRRILYNQLFGIDVNRSALGIAAFSLYLAALELNEDPITDIQDLKFDHLIGTTLFEADTISGDLPEPVTRRPFDAVVGNPPWTFVSRKNGSSKHQAETQDTLRPRRSPDHEFLAVASQLAGERGRIGMVMKATPFFSRDAQAVEARSTVLRKMAPTALVNLSFLRKEDLFPDATGPALLFFARCTLTPDRNQLLVGSVPWTPDFRRTGVFHVGPGEIRAVPLKRVLSTPPTLKAATFGTVRDGWLISKLERDFPYLEVVLKEIGIRPDIDRGQGFIVGGQPQKATPLEYFDLKVVTPDNFTPFRLTERNLDSLGHKTLHRSRSRSIFSGPLLLCPKGGYSSSVERGRYSAAVFQGDVLYTQNLYGVSFCHADPRWAFVLSGILNSCLTSFQLAFGGATWGLERPTVGPDDVLSLRVPHLASVPPHAIQFVIEAERRIAEAPSDPGRLEALDSAVFDIYEIEPDERILARESVARARHLIFENRSERSIMVRPPDMSALKTYATQVVQTVDEYLRARGERHLEAVVYTHRVTTPDLSAGIPGVTAVRFVMAQGGPKESPVVRDGDRAEMDKLAYLLRGRLEADIPPYLNERRQLRLYGADDLFILKPTESRCWTRTAGLNDADIILADHWLRRPDAAVS